MRFVLRQILVLLALLVTQFPSHAEQRVLVFAAASLKDALEDIAISFEQQTGHPLVLSFAGTSILARQIERGAPADVFISADQQWMDWLTERGLVGRQIVVARNQLVVAVRRDFKASQNLAKLLAGGPVALANPASVPAGRYARQALGKMGLWTEVARTAIRTENVRLALALVVRGEVDVAITYASDVAATADIRVAFVFASSDHAPIVYPASQLNSENKVATVLLAFLSTPRAVALFVKNGFQPPGN